MDATNPHCESLLSELTELRALLDRAERQCDLESLSLANRHFLELELKTELLLFMP